MTTTANYALDQLSPDDLTDLRGGLRHMFRNRPDDDVREVIAALEAGLIDGMVYRGPCACLIGTVVRVHWDATCPSDPMPAYDPAAKYVDQKLNRPRDSNKFYAFSRPIIRDMVSEAAESFAYDLRPGYTPENSMTARQLHILLNELLDTRAQEATAHA